MAYWLATGFVVAAALVSAIMVNAGAPRQAQISEPADVPEAVPVAAH